MKNRILGVLSAALFVVAATVASSATWAFLHQPKVPKSLQK